MSGIQLYQAHRNWRDRAPDERFGSLASLYEAVSARYETSWEQELQLASTPFVAEGPNQFGLYGGERLYVPTHFAFKQLTSLVGLQGEAYTNLLKYPVTLVREIVQLHAAESKREKMQVLYGYDKNGGSANGVIRGFNTMSYSRLWDWKLVKFIIEDIASQGDWVVPPAVTDDKYPSGLYASDHDVFIVLVNDNRRINDGSDGGLGRGFFAWNNEVGVGNGSPRSIGFQSFYYRMICGNHIVWGAENIFGVRLAHVGDDIDQRFKKDIRDRLVQFAEGKTHLDEHAIALAQSTSLGPNKEAVVKSLTTLRKAAWNKSDAEAVFDFGELKGSDPTVLWNFINLATEYSHVSPSIGPYADKRALFDQRAGALMNLVLE